MNNSIRWAALVVALLFAAAVGFGAYQAGVAHGIEQSGKIVVSPPPAGAYPYPVPYYGWHRPWGFGFFLGPFFFFAFFLFVVRGLFWRRAWHGGYGGGYGGGCGPRSRFDEWHRQAHGREGDAPAAGGPSER
jgi:hypothetical protein